MVDGIVVSFDNSTESESVTTSEPAIEIVGEAINESVDVVDSAIIDVTPVADSVVDSSVIESELEAAKVRITELEAQVADLQNQLDTIKLNEETKLIFASIKTIDTEISDVDLAKFPLDLLKIFNASLIRVASK